MRQLKQSVVFTLCLFVFASPGHTKVHSTPSATITADNFDAFYQQLHADFTELNHSLSNSQKKRFRESKRNPRIRLSRSDAKLKKRYSTLKEQKQKYDPVHALKENLIELYSQKAPFSFDDHRLNREATSLALIIIDKTRSLKKTYKSFFIPVVHNMLIDVGLKKRGACIHWAEDLLETLYNTPREFFLITWGQTHPGKITEHNVAVLLPNYGTFKDGLIVDPWRTAGKPFWIEVKNDNSHYDWRRFDGYGVY